MPQAPRSRWYPKTCRTSGPPRQRINVTIAPDLCDRLWADAHETHMAVSHIVEDALLAHYATLDTAETNKAVAV